MKNTGNNRLLEKFPRQPIDKRKESIYNDAFLLKYRKFQG